MIALTGSTGKIGRELVRELKADRTDTEFSTGSPVWTRMPDGRYYEYTVLTDAAGGEPVNLTKSPLAETNPDGVQSGAAFSPDGTRIAYTADPDQPFRFQLMVMDLRTRAVRRLTREAMSVHFPTWSPDGKTLAVTRSGDDHRGELLLVDAVSGALREVKAPTPATKPLGAPRESFTIEFTLDPAQLKPAS